MDHIAHGVTDPLGVYGREPNFVERVAQAIHAEAVRVLRQRANDAGLTGAYDSVVKSWGEAEQHVRDLHIACARAAIAEVAKEMGHAYQDTKYGPHWLDAVTGNCVVCNAVLEAILDGIPGTEVCAPNGKLNLRKPFKWDETNRHR